MKNLIQVISCCGELVQLFCDNQESSIEDEDREVTTVNITGTGECKACAKTFSLQTSFKSINCFQCSDIDCLPSHNGSRLCKSGSIASGGTRSHCSCGACF